jgi:hypothetical protein
VTAQPIFAPPIEQKLIAPPRQRLRESAADLVGVVAIVMLIAILLPSLLAFRAAAFVWRRLCS